MAHFTAFRSVRSAIFASVIIAVPGAGFAQGAGSAATPPASALPLATSGARGETEWEETTRAAERWATLGVVIPAGAGAAFSIITQPANQTHVPLWQGVTLVTLFGAAALWGVSMGYYRAGRPVYATLTGLAKTALLAGAIAIDRGCDACHGMPTMTVGALVAIVAWDVWEYSTLESSVRDHAARGANLPAVPFVAAVENRHLVMGIAARF